MCKITLIIDSLINDKRVISKMSVSPKSDTQTSVNGEATISLSKKEAFDKYACDDYCMKINASKSMADAAFTVSLLQDSWERENYVFAPAGAYNGNRYKSLPLEYPPISIGVIDDVENPQPVITDVPRLSNEESRSKLELKVGDLSKPLFGYFSPTLNKGYFILFEQQSIPDLDNGICISEKLDEKTADFSLVVPCKRDVMYRHMHMIKSDDVGASLCSDSVAEIRFRVYELPCKSITEYFHQFGELRKVYDVKNSYKNTVPFYKAFKAIESKYNRINWVHDHSFYRSSAAGSDSICSQWQTGWVGGGMSTYPKLIAGGRLSKERSMQTLDFLFRHILTENGLMYGIFYNGECYGDDIDPKGNKNHLLMRKFTDAVYFILKQFILLEEMGEVVPEKWRDSLQKSLETLAEIFEKNGQFGQFVDINSKKLIVRGTSSAATAIGALALGYSYYGDARFLNTAISAGEYYFSEYIEKGLSNGGPGEICQCPDSESIFGMLESYVALYDISGEQKWIDYAKVCADIASSWCVAYDFKFPKHSQFYKRGINATGAVWASIQNKHAAPGICTLSGVSLFKLYRATGEEKYLTLFKEISHNITQFVSLNENPFYFSYGGKPTTDYNPEGFSGERVNLSDWEGKENVGELPNGSCWNEVTMLLNFVDNPGIYIVKDKEQVFSFDHVENKILRANNDEMLIELANNTEYDCTVTVFEETSKLQKNPMRTNPWEQYQKVFIPKNSFVKLLFFK